MSGMLTKRSCNHGLENSIDVEICFCVWGETYLKLLLEVSIPSFLFENNIPVLSKQTKVTINFYTDSEGIEKIKSHPIYNKIIKYASVDFIPIVDSLKKESDKYNISAKCFYEFIKKLTEKPCVGIFPAPDAVIGDGTLLHAYQKVLEGYKVIVIPNNTRTVDQTIVPELKSKFNSQDTISNEELIELATKHFHPYTSTHFFNVPETNSWASSIFYQGKGGAIFHKTYFFHPFMLVCYDKKLPNTIPAMLDHDALNKLGFTDKELKKELYAVKESKDCGLLEISPMECHKTDALHFNKFRVLKKWNHFIYYSWARIDRYYYRFFKDYTFIYRTPGNKRVFLDSIKFKMVTFPIITAQRFLYYYVKLHKMYLHRKIARIVLQFIGKIVRVDIVGLLKERKMG